MAIVTALRGLRAKLDAALAILSPLEDVLAVLEACRSASTTETEAPQGVLDPLAGLPIPPPELPTPGGPSRAVLEASQGIGGTCLRCGKPFVGKSPVRVFCSDDCKREAQKAARKASGGKSRRTAPAPEPVPPVPNGAADLEPIDWPRREASFASMTSHDAEPEEKRLLLSLPDV